MGGRMFYFCFFAIASIVFLEWKKQDLDLMTLQRETHALSRSLAGSKGAPEWLQTLILDFELAGFSYLSFLANLSELGEEIRSHNRKILSCYSAKSCNILVIYMVLSSLRVDSNVYFCLVILAFSTVSVYGLGFQKRRQVLSKLAKFARPFDIDFSRMKEANTKTFRQKYSTVTTLGTMAELAVFLIGMMGAAHSI